MIINKLKRAWLITWEWHGDRNAVPRKVASILSYRFSELTICSIVEQIYVDSELSLCERLDYAKNKRNVPYPAIVRNFHISCGHNPYLWARMVKNLHVIQEEGIERLEWEETSNPNENNIRMSNR